MDGFVADSGHGYGVATGFHQILIVEHGEFSWDFALIKLGDEAGLDDGPVPSFRVGYWIELGEGFVAGRAGVRLYYDHFVLACRHVGGVD